MALAPRRQLVEHNKVHTDSCVQRFNSTFTDTAAPPRETHLTQTATGRKTPVRTCFRIMKNRKWTSLTIKGFKILSIPIQCPLTPFFPYTHTHTHTHTGDTAIHELFNPPFLPLYFILSIFHVSNYKSTSGERCWSSHLHQPLLRAVIPNVSLLHISKRCRVLEFSLCCIFIRLKQIYSDHILTIWSLIIWEMQKIKGDMTTLLPISQKQKDCHILCS